MDKKTRLDRILAKPLTLGIIGCIIAIVNPNFFSKTIIFGTNKIPINQMYALVFQIFVIDCLLDLLSPTLLWIINRIVDLIKGLKKGKK